MLLYMNKFTSVRMLVFMKNIFNIRFILFFIFFLGSIYGIFYLADNIECDYYNDEIIEKYNTIDPYWHNNNELSHAVRGEYDKLHVLVSTLSSFVSILVSIIWAFIFLKKENRKTIILPIIAYLIIMIILDICYYICKGLEFNFAIILVPGLMIFAVIYETVKIKKEEKKQKTESDSAAIPES